MTKRIAIVGLGLMGGSLALAIRPHIEYLAAVDLDPSTLVAAEGLADFASPDLEKGIRHVELIILAAPVRAILRHLKQLPQLRRDGCLVLDLGSTKSEISRSMEALPTSFSAIGGHPLCGKEIGGFNSASSHLFEGHAFVLCSNGRTDQVVQRAAEQIVTWIGSRPIYLPADLHDELVAVTSHLPYLVAATLMRSARALNDDRLWQVSASGFRDTSRLAASNPEMLRDILISNRPAILSILDEYQEELTRLSSLLRAGDEAQIYRWLQEVKRAHSDYLRRRGSDVE